ncbi:MAG: Ig-like domain-containing protein, partial [Isosphaeraceae bacterium]|nr:Ig-like domain-containing protein [Isosphaeraceae bacterium]
RLPSIRPRRQRRRPEVRPLVALLEGRTLPAPLNILVDDPTVDTTTQDTQSETSVLAFPGRDGSPIVLAVFNDSGSYLSGRRSFTGYARSTDGGQTFTDLGAPPVSAAGDGGDPVLARDAVTGRIYWSTLSLGGNPIQVFRSDDDGLTFQAPVNAAPGRASTDKEWITVDNAPGDGQGTVYLLVRDFDGGNGIFLFKSTDGGDTWGPNGGVLIASGSAHNVQGANIVVGPDHAVYAAYFDQSSPQAIRVRKSTDGGNTFGPPVTVATLSTTGTNGDLGLVGIRAGTTSPSGFRSDAFPQMAVNPINGQIYVVYNDNPPGPDKGDIFFKMSSDGGATWSTPVRVNNDETTNDQFLPTLAVTPDGTKVGVFWYDRRLDPANNLIDYFGAIGTVSDTSVTFGPNDRITDTSFLPEFGRDPVVNSVYMGDYDEASADNDFFYVTHVDNRLPSLRHTGNQQDVVFSKISVNAVGPEVLTGSPLSTLPGLGSFRVTFNEPIDPTTFDPSDITLLGPDRALIPIDSVTPVPGSNDTQFDIRFAPLGGPGIYKITIEPDLYDRLGNLMDNNLNGIPSEVPYDQFSSSITIFGPRITASTPGGTQAPGVVSSLRVTFNESIDPTTFDPSDVVLVEPGGIMIPVTSVTPVTGTNNTQFVIAFPTLTATGTYRVTIGPDIQDFFGNAMDQNNNFIPGEIPGDQFTTTLNVFGPRITASTPSGPTPAPISHIQVTFNESIDPATFDPSDVILVGPGGLTISITSVTPIAGSNNTRFDIAFPEQSTVGSYRAVIGPDIQDFFGNAMDQNNNFIPGEIPGDQFVLNFSIFQIVPYQFEAVPLDFVELAGDPQAFTIITTADDLSVAVNLGSNTFTFYNSTYTGNNQLFVSSNGLITFGQANGDFTNSNLTASPPQAAIAPLWDDWVNSNVNNASNPMVLGKFVDLDGDGTLDELIIEWNQIWHFASSPSTVTFEAILRLNTGTTQGDIYFEYLDLDTGDTNRNGASATVGIKESGTQPTTGGNRVLINFNSGSNPLVQSGTAIRLFVSGGSQDPEIAAQFDDPFATPIADPPKPPPQEPLLGGNDDEEGGDDGDDDGGGDGDQSPHLIGLPPGEGQPEAPRGPLGAPLRRASSLLSGPLVDQAISELIPLVGDSPLDLPILPTAARSRPASRPVLGSLLWS